MRTVPNETQLRRSALRSHFTSVPQAPAPEGFFPLGGMTFASSSVGPLTVDHPNIRVDLEVGPAHPVYETWFSPRPVTYASTGELSYAFDGEVLFGTLSYAANDMEARTRQIYGAILDLLETKGYPHLIRVWNHIPHINRYDQDGEERYRAFCKGRSLALLDDRGLVEAGLPAGTGVGSIGDQVTIAFLASARDVAVHLENPNQMPAYRYPQRYGPRSPSFARATAVRYDDGSCEIFVSGTAGIIGHETRHPGDVLGQCRTTLANLTQLLSRDNLSRYGLDHHLTPAHMNHLKVYVRHCQDLETIQAFCRQVFAPDISLVYLPADICRSDLLVEIEGRVFLPPTGGGPCR